jgi:hypothetical protein
VISGSLGAGVGEGVVGVRSGQDIIRLFPDALRVLQAFHSGLYPFRIAAASSADTPQVRKMVSRCQVHRATCLVSPSYPFNTPLPRTTTLLDTSYVLQAVKIGRAAMELLEV